jgi:cell division protein FtsA
MDKVVTTQDKGSPIVVGLDIGTTKICAIVGRRNKNGKIEVLGIGKAESAGVTRGVVSNIDKTVQGITQAVEIAGAQSNVEIKVVNVGIAGQHIKSLQHRGLITRRDLESEISRKDIDKLVEDMFNLVMPPGEGIIHVIPQEFTVDGEPGIKDPIGMAGVRLEANFHIISGQTAAIKNIVKCVNKAELESVDLILEPLASSESVLSDEEKEAGVVLVDIGGGTTDIAIFHEGIIRHTAVVPFGGNSITEDIREGLSVLRNIAEQLKIRFGSALAEENKENEIVCVPGLRGREPKEISVKNLAFIIQARMEEIIEHVYFEIKSSGYDKKLIAGIVVTGGGAQLKHLPQLVEFFTGLDCRIGYPNEHLAKNEVLPKNVYEDLQSPMYATGIGLLIKGVQKMEYDGLPPTVAVEDVKKKIKGKPQEKKPSWIDMLKDYIKDETDTPDKEYLQ